MERQDGKVMELKQKNRILEIAPNGLGYGNPDATISLEKFKQDTELAGQVEAAAEIIRSGECIVEVSHDDDGCIDGRPAVEVIYPVSEGGTITLVKAPVHHPHERRALVAGGGAITCWACSLGAKGPGANLQDDLRATVATLHEHHLHFGAHTGEHGDDKRTDCGANDKAEAIVANVTIYEVSIQANVALVYETMELPFSETRWGEVVARYKAANENGHYFAGSTGHGNLDIIADGFEQDAEGQPTGVIKELGGNHCEGFIYLNFVPGTTFDQARLQEQLAQQFSDSERHLQVFVVDIWRIRQLAEASATTPEEIDAAFMSGLAYQLATAATLTDGTQRVFAGLAA